MYQTRFQRPSKPAVFLVLMGLSLVSLMLPVDIFRPARQSTQLIAIAQLGVRETVRGAGQAIDNLAESRVSTDEHDQLQREKIALENRLAALSQQVEKLRADNRRLTAVRNMPGFPKWARLMPAKVIADDGSHWRESLWVGKGSGARVRSGDPVASRIFVQAGSENGVADAYHVLAGECLIGWVEQVNRWTSRVVLLSDPYANKALRVRIVGTQAPQGADNVPDRGEQVYVLHGAGEGKMIISDIPVREKDAGWVRRGDLVVTDPNNPQFPMCLTVGSITQLEVNRKNPLYCNAVVEPRLNPEALSEVYVVDLQAVAP